MNEIVKYDNSMNSLKFKNFTKRDFDFFFAICAKVRDKHTDQVSLSFNELRELSGYSDNDRNRFIKDLEGMNEKLAHITYRYEDDESITLFVLFTKFKILKTRDEIQIRVAEEFEFLLNDLDRNFTRYELETFIGLNSKHTKTLYRLLKQWRINGKTQIYKVDELKALFESTSENKVFLRDVLKPAVQELTEKGLFKNLIIVPEKAKKRGAPVIGYSFSFARETVIVSDQVEGQTEFKDKKDFDRYVENVFSKPKKNNIHYDSERERDVKAEEKALLNKKNKFNNFEQRNYDFDELEKMLLKNN